MASRATIDRQQRASLLRELRRSRQVRESAHELTPAQPIEQTEALLTCCQQVNPGAATSDEWLRLLARLRRAGDTRGPLASSTCTNGSRSTFPEAVP